MPKSKSVREILRNWFPYHGKGWGDHISCPCDKCREYRITQAQRELWEVISWEIEKIKEGNYINSPDAQKALSDVLAKLKEMMEN